MPLENAREDQKGQSGDAKSSASETFSGLDLYKSVKDSVADVSATTYWAGFIPTSMSYGKGFFVKDPQQKGDDNSCLLVTDNHVVTENASLQISDEKGTSHKAVVDFRDEENDIAFLKIENTNSSPVHCPALELVNDKQLHATRELGVVVRGADADRKYYYAQTSRLGQRAESGLPLQNKENPNRELMMMIGSGGKPGDSGAPFLNKKGQVEGMIAGGGGLRIYATPANMIAEALLKRTIGK